jgi:hypothetical protein
MRTKAGIWIIICLLSLVGMVAGHLPDTSTISTTNPWVIANGADQTIVTVMVSNSSSGAVQGASVIFTIDNPIYGTFNPATVVSDPAGKATSTFKVNTRSGTAAITANITSPDGYSISKTITQNIDHDTPYYSYFLHPLSGTVATTVPFNISITDRWGNQIDDRRGYHGISLHVHGPAPDDCGFAEAGYNHTISKTLDANGNISTTVKLTSKIGPNNIMMDAFGSIPDKLEWINADTNGIPFSITQDVSPSGSPPTIPADGTSFFTIAYTLFDVYGNPTNNQPILVTTSINGEEKTFQSNNLGQVTIKYGPKSTIGEIDITGTSVANSTVTVTQKVRFKNTGAEIISLTANPDIMASCDVPPSTSFSNIIATVADHTGNAVEGETVTFNIENITYDGIYNHTAEPYLLNSSAITDVYGQSIVQFIPGNFTTAGNPGFNASATGHCNVVAQWNGTFKTIPVSWKNYPYLSVSTAVTPLTVGINQTVDVSIAFSGDGWALQPKPIDVLLVLDNSGSMGSTINYNDGVSQSKRAATTFIKQMAKGRDRVGVIFYDKNTYPNFSVYVPLTYDLDSVNSSISGYSRTDTKGYHTRTRYALYQGIKLMNLWNDRGAVRAIIHMTDGQWSMEGDPLARSGAIGFNQGFSPLENVPNGLHSVWAGNVVGVTDKYRYFDDLGGGTAVNGSRNDFPNGQTYNTGKIGWADQPENFETTQNYTTKTSWYFTNAENSNQNMSVYAKESDIKVYSIGFTPSANYDNIKLVLQTMSNATGGFYKYAPGETELKTVYKEIADNLKDTAGVNTTMTVDFQNVNVTGITMPGNEVYSYVYHPNASTKIGWQDNKVNISDQTADWAADNKLDFTIGTIKVGQRWNATFRLRVNQSGIIDIFGKNSTVTFNGGTEKLTIPQTFITVVPHLNLTEITVKMIALSNLTITEPGEIKALLPVMWNTTYTGNQTITEKVFYSVDDGPWVLFDTKMHPYIYGANSTTTDYVDYSQLDVKKLPPGGYRIKIYATAADAPDAWIGPTEAKMVGGQGKIYLKLE